MTTTLEMTVSITAARGGFRTTIQGGRYGDTFLWTPSLDGKSLDRIKAHVRGYFSNNDAGLGPAADNALTAALRPHKAPEPWAPAATKAERTFHEVEADSASHAILNALNGQSMHQAEIVEHTGLARSTVRRVLKALEGLVDYDTARTENDKMANYWIANDDGGHVCDVLDAISHGYSKVVNGDLVEEE